MLCGSYSQESETKTASAWSVFSNDSRKCAPEFECSGGPTELASVKTQEDLQEHHDRAGERMHEVARSCAKEHLPTVTVLEGA